MQTVTTPASACLGDPANSPRALADSHSYLAARDLCGDFRTAEIVIRPV
jgi:hypothetical protein